MSFLERSKIIGFTIKKQLIYTKIHIVVTLKFFDLSLHLNNFPIKEAKLHLSEIQKMKQDMFKAHILARKQFICNFHLTHNHFYQSFAKGCNPQEWSTVPVMKKYHLQQPLEKRLSDGFYKHSVYINKTSGSSGNPFTFAKDRFCHALTWAVIMDRFSWYSIDFNSSKQARFYGIPLDKKNYYKERIKDWFGNRYRFTVFNLEDEAFEKCLVKFKNTAFQYINGYTSPITQFAKFLRRKNIILTSICPSLRICIVTSEMLFEDDRALMEQQFGVPVINEYGASELDLIAFQNNKGDLQLNTETLYVEILDEHDNILPYGKEGRIVITSLYNEAHPFIRYDIGDIGLISKDSAMTKPILKKLVGRSNDLVILPSGKKAAGLTFYYITKSIIEDDGNVKEFIIEQFKPSQFKISYTSLKDLSTKKIEIIKKEIENYLESGIDITFERLKQLERSKSGKLKQFTSYLNSNQ